MASLTNESFFSRSMRAAGKKARDQKPRIDQFAAAVILQDFLDAQQGTALLPPDPADGEGAA